MRYRFFLLLGLLALLGLPSDGPSQFPPPGGMSGGRGFGDPSKMFDMMSGGKDIITRDGLTSPWMQGMFDRFAQQLNITDGKLTREQFNTYLQQKMASGASPGPGGSSRSSSAPSGTPGGESGRGGPPPMMGGNSAEMADRWAEGMFRRADANGDGLVNYDEMSETLRTERDKWDANKDGFIDLDEYKPYFRGALQQRMAENGGSGMFGGEGSLPLPVPAAPIEEEEPKPTVWRAGKLPKDLPSWFKTVDADSDGQISLYEWRTAGRALEDFPDLDRNGDRFLTIAEVQYYAGGKNNLNGVALVTASTDKAKTEGRPGDGKASEGRPSFGSSSSEGRPSFGGSSASDGKSSRGSFGGSRFGR